MSLVMIREKHGVERISEYMVDKESWDRDFHRRIEELDLWPDK